MFVYVQFTTGARTRQVKTVTAAKRLVLNRFPGAHFGKWASTNGSRSLTVWPSEIAEQEYKAGDTSNKNQPRAYVVVQRSELTDHSSELEPHS